MGREQWLAVKQMRGFYVRTYRWMQKMLIVSTGVSVLLSFIIVYLYATRGQSSFYATSGESLPIKLKPLDHPNESATPLLANDLPKKTRAI